MAPDTQKVAMTSIEDALGRLWTAADDARMLQCDGQWVHWGQIRELAEQIDVELTSAGCGPGGRVAVVLGNRWSRSRRSRDSPGRTTLVTVSPLQPTERLSADLAASGPLMSWRRDACSDQVLVDAVAELGAAAYSVDGPRWPSRQGDPTTVRVIRRSPSRC